MQPGKSKGVRNRFSKHSGAGCEPNPYQADDVKWTDECTTGAGWLSVKHRVKRLRQAIAADFIAVAGHRTCAAPHTY